MQSCFCTGSPNPVPLPENRCCNRDLFSSLRSLCSAAIVSPNVVDCANLSSRLAGFLLHGFLVIFLCVRICHMWDSSEKRVNKFCFTPSLFEGLVGKCGGKCFGNRFRNTAGRSRFSSNQSFHARLKQIPLS